MIQPLPTSTLFPYTTLFRSILHYNTPDGQYTGLFNSLKAGLKKYNITAKADQSFFLDLSRAQEIARTVITKLKDAGVTTRSEEHTSELQSLRHLVCRLLLEK